jgi:hypothetical protein
VQTRHCFFFFYFFLFLQKEGLLSYLLRAASQESTAAGVSTKSRLIDDSSDFDFLNFRFLFSFSSLLLSLGCRAVPPHPRRPSRAMPQRRCCAQRVAARPPRGGDWPLHVPARLLPLRPPCARPRLHRPPSTPAAAAAAPASGPVHVARAGPRRHPGQRRRRRRWQHQPSPSLPMMPPRAGRRRRLRTAAGEPLGALLLRALPASPRCRPRAVRRRGAATR